MMNEYNPDGKDIRFIDSHYKDLFRIPDGSCIQIDYPNETVVKPCKFIDEYHTQIGNNVFHICQFAEIMERNGARYMAEPEIMGEEAAWKVGRDRILAVQTCEDGYDYTLFDEHYNEIDGGQVDNPDMSMIEVRQDILESFHLAHRELRAISRLGRHFVMTSEFVEKIFPMMGIRLICVNDDYDSSNENCDSSALLLPFKMVMNDSYVKDISKKIRSSINAKINSGEYLPSASSIPYGYVRNAEKNTFDIDEEVAPVIVRIFEMRANGIALNSIAGSFTAKAE